MALGVKAGCSGTLTFLTDEPLRLAWIPTRVARYGSPYPAIAVSTRRTQ